MAGHDALPKQCRIDAWEIPMVLRADPLWLPYPPSPYFLPPSARYDVFLARLRFEGAGELV